MWNVWNVSFRDHKNAKNAIWVSAHVHMSGLGISKPQGGPDFLNDFCEFIIWLFNIAMENHIF